MLCFFCLVMRHKNVILKGCKRHSLFKIRSSSYNMTKSNSQFRFPYFIFILWPWCERRKEQREVFFFKVLLAKTALMEFIHRKCPRWTWRGTGLFTPTRQVLPLLSRENQTTSIFPDQGKFEFSLSLYFSRKSDHELFETLKVYSRMKSHQHFTAVQAHSRMDLSISMVQQWIYRRITNII